MGISTPAKMMLPRLVLVTLLCLLSLSWCTFVPVSRTKEDFDAQKRDRLLSKYKSGDIAFVLCHYNDDFMHSHGGLPQLQFLQHVSNMDTFALLVDQTDPDVLAKATDFSHEKAMVIEPILGAYQKATAALDDRNIDDFVEELVVKGPLNEAGRLKFLREHIDAISDDVLGRFPPALIRKLMVGTERLDGVLQSNFLEWINDLPYFAEIEVKPKTLIDAIEKLCTESPLNMPLIERLVGEAPSTVLEELRGIPWLAKEVEGFLAKSKVIQNVLAESIFPGSYKWLSSKDFKAILGLKPSTGVLMEFLKDDSITDIDFVHLLLDAATPAQLHRLYRMPKWQFRPLVNGVLEERLVGLAEGMHMFRAAAPWAIGPGVVGHINDFLGTDYITTQKLKRFYKVSDPKGGKLAHEEELIKLVRSKATDSEIVDFLKKKNQLQNCKMLVAYANEVGPDFSNTVAGAFVTAYKNSEEFGSKMAALLSKIRSPMLTHFISRRPFEYRDIEAWVSFLRTTSQPIYFLALQKFLSSYSRRLVACHLDTILRERASGFLEAAKAGNVEAVKAAFDRCEPFLHPDIIKEAHSLAEGHEECSEYLERHFVYWGKSHKHYINLWVSICKQEDGGGKRIRADLAKMCIATQQDLIVDLFKAHNLSWSGIKISKFDWTANAKQFIKWFDLKAVEVFAFRSRCLGMTLKHEFMKTLLALRPDLKLVEAAFEKEKLIVDRDKVGVEKESVQAKKAASIEEVDKRSVLPIEAASLEVVEE